MTAPVTSCGPSVVAIVKASSSGARYTPTLAMPALCSWSASRSAGDSEAENESHQTRAMNSRSASAYGSCRMRTALTTLKTAVVPPMPSASEMTTVAVKPGFRRAMRAAMRKSAAASRKT